VVDVFFDVRSFANFIADMNIHLRPRITEEIPRRFPVPYKPILHPRQQGQIKIKGL
jgi:hypothetical protein